MMWSSFPLVPYTILSFRRAALPALLFVASLTACDAFDAILEGEAPAEQFLRIGWPLGEIPVARGETRIVNVAITRKDDYDKKASVAVSGFPSGITGSVTTTSSGDAITAAISLTVAPTVPNGLYGFTLRVGGERLKAASRSVKIRVMNPPSFTLGVNPTTIDVVRGGIMPVTVNIVRDNYPQPVTLALQSDGGFTAAFTPSPVTGNTASAFIEVPDNAATGTHTVSVVSNPTSGAPVSAALTVNVLSDELQIVADPTVTTRQGKSVRQNFILNARSTIGDISLASAGLPDGVETAFSPVAGREYSLTVTASPLVPAGSYPFEVVASAPGIAEAKEAMVLVVQPSSLGVTAFPGTVSVFQGASAAIDIALVREFLDTTVAVTIEGVPTGLSATPPSLQLTEDAATLKFMASESAPIGTHTVTIVGTPAGWPGNAAARRNVQVTVRAAPPAPGNVYVDWSSCGAPSWLAVQDGNGAWTAVPATGNATRVSIVSGRGGIAWSRRDSLQVRFQTQTEFTDFPENLCPPVRFSRTANGSGAHQNAGEEYSYGYGGATATSRLSAPSFSLFGIAPGTHDLVIWGTSLSPNFQPRGLIRRAVDVADGGSLGTLDLTGEESFTPVTAPLTVTSQLSGGMTASMSYLTREACFATPLYNLNLTIQQGAWRGTMLGVPTEYQHPQDLHLLTLRHVVNSREIFLRVPIGALASRSLAMPPNTGAPVVSEIPTPYRRLQLTTGTQQNAYSRDVLFEYSGNGKHVSIMMTRAYNPAINITVGLPDFSSVAGWSASLVPAEGVLVNWAGTYRGGSYENPCAPDFSSAAIRFTGTR